MRKYLILFIIFFFPITSFAQKINYYVTLKHNKVHVRYGPSMDYQIKYIYRKAGYPLKVIDRKENFRKIIDHKNNSGWIHWTQLDNNISLITTSEKILFKKPTKFSEPLAKLSEGRLLIVIKCQDKWCNIKTEDYEGWILKDNNLWGKIN